MFFIHAFVKSPFQLKIFIAVFLLACMKIGQEGLLGKITGRWSGEPRLMRLHGAPETSMASELTEWERTWTLPFIYFLFPIVSRAYKIALLYYLSSQ